MIHFAFIAWESCNCDGATTMMQVVGCAPGVAIAVESWWRAKNRPALSVRVNGGEVLFAESWIQR